MTLSSLLSVARRLFEPGSLSRQAAPRDRSTLIVNPTYVDLLRRLGLNRASDFLRLREEVLSGHLDRQVSRVCLGDGVTAYLKREHRVPWKERLRNWWEGYGYSSKSWREMRTLRLLRTAFDSCPDWIAAGELDDGRAFLLLADVPGTLPLPRLLQTGERLETARQLGRALARLHASGFVHGDLYANHVLVETATGRVCFLDWQRASQSSGKHWRDLATLSATLSPDLAPCRDRLVCLEAYLTESGDRGLSLREAARRVEYEARRLRGRRHVRAKARPLHIVERQRLLNLDGESLQVTTAFRELWPDELPRFLEADFEERRVLPLPDGETALFVRRHYRPGSGRWTSPERLRMNLLNRLERFGVAAPRVLAVGERPLRDGRVAAFLLTRTAAVIPLEEWLAQHPVGAVRANLLRQIGTVLARLHEAGCYFRGTVNGMGVVDERPCPRVVVADVEGLVVRRRWRALWRWLDLRCLGWLAHQDRQLVFQGYRRSRLAGEVG